MFKSRVVVCECRSLKVVAEGYLCVREVVSVSGNATVRVFL